MGPSGGLDEFDISSFHRDSTPGPIHLLASRYTGYAIPEHTLVGNLSNEDKFSTTQKMVAYR